MNNTISDFARRTGFDGFAQDVFGGMKGNPFVKQALTAALFSRPEAPLHLLIVGNPGTGKTTIKHIAKKTFNGLTLSAGANSTKAGLLFNARSGTPGILLSGNGKIVLLDEMDKIAEDDIEYCYEIMSEGKCTIAAGDIQEEVESRPIIIAFCNPAYGSFVYSPLDKLAAYRLHVPTLTTPMHPVYSYLAEAFFL